MPDSAPPLRVVQWATGNIGARALRAVIEHPRLDLAGVHVHSAEKAGRDAAVPGTRRVALAMSARFISCRRAMRTTSLPIAIN